MDFLQCTAARPYRPVMGAVREQKLFAVPDKPSGNREVERQTGDEHRQTVAVIASIHLGQVRNIASKQDSLRMFQPSDLLTVRARCTTGPWYKGHATQGSPEQRERPWLLGPPVCWAAALRNST